MEEELPKLSKSSCDSHRNIISQESVKYIVLPPSKLQASKSQR